MMLIDVIVAHSDLEMSKLRHIDNKFQITWRVTPCLRVYFILNNTNAWMQKKENKGNFWSINS